jgi:nucleotidyltransferase/DNA polymerase involved in DNA repair
MIHSWSETGHRGKTNEVAVACSYEAREFGAHSAMPMPRLGRRRPQPSPQLDRARLLAHPDVELSLDEVTLMFTCVSVLNGSAILNRSREIRLMILRTVLIARVSYNKFLAKFARS